MLRFLMWTKRYPEFLQELHFNRSRTGQMERIFLRRLWPMESMLLIRQGYIWRRSILLATGWKRVADGRR